MRKIKLYDVLYLFALASVVVGFLNFRSSERTAEYEQVPGYITDVEVISVLTKTGYQPRYNYVIHWFADDEEHARSVHEAFSAPDESATEFWASRDHTDVITAEPTGIRSEAYLNWCVAAVCAIAGWIISSKDRQKMKSNRKGGNEDVRIRFSIVAGCMLVGIALVGFILFMSGQGGYYVPPALKDLLVVFLAGFLICLIGIRKNR